jgi:hypothetical protein
MVLVETRRASARCFTAMPGAEGLVEGRRQIQEAVAVEDLEVQRPVLMPQLRQAQMAETRLIQAH